jgi:hypothetical protein
LTRALWAAFFTVASLVAAALATALAIGVPHPLTIERAAAGAFGLLGIGAGSIALSARVDAGRPAAPRSRRSEDDHVDAGAARLIDLERSLRLGTATAGDFHAQVRPILVPLARARLARKGILLEDRERAIQVLGTDNYALVDPRAVPPADRFGRGVPLERVRLLLGQLEALEDHR